MKTENLKSSNLSNISIIETQKDEHGNLTVDARKLHNKLKIKTEFARWIERRIQEFDFQEGLEFSSRLTKNNPGRGRMAVEYQLSITMAQELCILDNSEI
jgi:anti-repressor protein